MSEPLLVWGFALLGVAAALLVLELFIPSGGVIGLVAGAAVVASLVCFWRVNTMWGLSSTLGVVVLTPVVVAFFLKVWPDTPVGRRLILGGDEESEGPLQQSEQRRREERARREALIGAEGEALTDLHPVGAVRVAGQRHEGLAQGGFVDAGQRVRVVGVEGTSLKVRRVAASDERP